MAPLWVRSDYGPAAVAAPNVACTRVAAETVRLVAKEDHTALLCDPLYYAGAAPVDLESGPLHVDPRLMRGLKVFRQRLAVTNQYVVTITNYS